MRTTLLLALLLLCAGCDRGDHPRQTGTPAPEFTVTDTSHRISLADYRGKVVVLNFWATWCAPCIEELPSLTAMQHDLPEVQVLAVSVDEDPEAYRQFLTEHKLGLLTVNDRSKHTSDLFHSYRWPESYVIDRQGVIRRKFIGAQNWTSPEILEYLRRL